ncbi:hypothetical protein [Nesterenkonia sp. PF2B19]|uniref:hypothetical protein n=1 Tax=Nesterenkonia sp. PF2B19 TaxID=1881858 RepID=UPI0008726AAE|nr:hypothetical protein [Nesterenkonia sp. PF2B19]OSM43491.1 hypothetical protein BCY76_008205 [Nesterenkonia sp. PF2B19]
MSLEFNPENHRYRLDGRPVRGVTGLIAGGTPKDALIWWAATKAGEWAAENKAALATLADDSIIREAKMAHKQAKDTAGITGTAVHDLAERLHQTGEVTTADPLHGSYIEGYAEFLDAWEIEPALFERPCASRADWWAGTFDLLCRSPYLADGELVQIDLKTSKSVYGETAMQTAAYSRAEFYLDQDGAEQPMPEVHATYVAHVTPLHRDGEAARYEGKPLGTSLYQLAGNPAEIATQYGWFLAAAYTAKTKKLRDRLITEPLTAPNAATAA